MPPRGGRHRVLAGPRTARHPVQRAPHPMERAVSRPHWGADAAANPPSIPRARCGLLARRQRYLIPSCSVPHLDGTRRPGPGLGSTISPLTRSYASPTTTHDKPSVSRTSISLDRCANHKLNLAHTTAHQNERMSPRTSLRLLCRAAARGGRLENGGHVTLNQSRSSTRVDIRSRRLREFPTTRA